MMVVRMLHKAIQAAAQLLEGRGHPPRHTYAAWLWGQRGSCGCSGTRHLVGSQLIADISMIGGIPIGLAQRGLHQPQRPPCSDAPMRREPTVLRLPPSLAAASVCTELSFIAQVLFHVTMMMMHNLSAHCSCAGCSPQQHSSQLRLVVCCTETLNSSMHAAPLSSLRCQPRRSWRSRQAWWHAKLQEERVRCGDADTGLQVWGGGLGHDPSPGGCSRQARLFGSCFDVALPMV